MIARIDNSVINHGATHKREPTAKLISFFLIQCSEKFLEPWIPLAFPGYDPTPAVSKSRTLPPVAKLHRNPCIQMPALQVHCGYYTTNHWVMERKTNGFFHSLEETEKIFQLPFLITNPLPHFTTGFSVYSS
jgi:hypothetical protein